MIPNKRLFACAVLVVGAIASADAPARSLDAGTWVRQSFTVVPVQVGDCPSDEAFRKRAWRRHNAEILPMVRSIARAEAQQEESHCREARGALAAGLAGDWSGLLSMQRFDRNDLPAADLEAVSSVAGTRPWSEVGPILERRLADTLRGLLAAKALERSEHLASSQAQNSSIATKMKVQDVTDSELVLLRNSAHVLMLGVTGLDVERRKKGLLFRADFTCALWSFDPVSRSFRLEGSWTAHGSEEGAAGSSGAEVARSGRQFGARVLDLPAFRFTTQILSGREGSWLNPASSFNTNTSADLGMNRRFRYFENREEKSGETRSVQAGWGYIVDHSAKDSVWTLRHVGGIQPYAGLVLEEIPGDGWGFLSFTQVGSRVSGDFAPPRGDDGRRYVELRSNSPQWELRFGGRAPLGSSHSFLTLDVPLSLGDVHGALVDDHGFLGIPTPSDSSRAQDRKEAQLLLGWGLDVGWTFRHNIRRLFWEAGAQAGFRMNTVWLGDASTNTGMHSDKTQLALEKADWLRNFEGVVTLHTGLSWSLTPWSGMGVQLNWDWLDGRSDWEVGSGDDYSSADWKSVPGRLAGTSRLRLLVQYMWK